MTILLHWRLNIVRLSYGLYIALAFCSLQIDIVVLSLSLSTRLGLESSLSYVFLNFLEQIYFQTKSRVWHNCKKRSGPECVGDARVRITHASIIQSIRVCFINTCSNGQVPMYLRIFHRYLNNPTVWQFVRCAISISEDFFARVLTINAIFIMFLIGIFNTSPVKGAPRLFLKCNAMCIMITLLTIYITRYLFITVRSCAPRERKKKLWPQNTHSQNAICSYKVKDVRYII